MLPTGEYRAGGREWPLTCGFARAGEGIRTPDLRITSALLSLLSYSGNDERV